VVVAVQAAYSFSLWAVAVSAAAAEAVVGDLVALVAVVSAEVVQAVTGKTS